MYNMAKVKSSMRKYVMALLFVAIGIIIGTSMLCGCTCGKEGFVVPSRFSDVDDVKGGRTLRMVTESGARLAPSRIRASALL